MHSFTPHMLVTPADTCKRSQLDPNQARKCRVWSGSKLFDTLMVFLKSADDTVRYSITAFCHVSVYTCHLIALKFEADKDFFNYRHQRSCQTYFSCCGGTPKKRISKAILSSRSEGTMSVTTFGCVWVNVKIRQILKEVKGKIRIK